MLIRTALDVGRALRQARRRKGLSQQRLAEGLGTTQRWVSEIERGKPNAEIGRVLAAFAYLGEPVSVGGDAPTQAPGGSGGRPPIDINRIVDS